ncbi:uncharacterized protein [Fopius arisanus]|uniref:Atp6ap1 protein n=1 Tax=Fopius arisanus TaxID=64838 RepID=A0A0C9QH31_9HYME|nr:PREDICTED: uncharacterized protein LOC105263751 [Fopius arisanus]
MRNPRYLITWVLIFFTSAPILSILGGDAVPVLIWGGDTSESGPSPVNPLGKTSQADFEKIVSKKVDGSQPPLLVFMRDNLCVEDFVQHRKDLVQLKNVGSLQYFPAVDSPLSVFETLSMYNQSVEEFDTVLEGQLIFTKATDLDAIAGTFNMIKESSPNLIGVLTGGSCSYSRSERVRRAVEVKADNTTEFLIARNESRLLAYADRATFRNGADGKIITLGRPTTVETTGNTSLGEPIRVNAMFQDEESVKTNLIFEMIRSTSGYWSMKKIEMLNENKSTVELKTKTEIVFPKDFSFHCSPIIRFINSTEKVSLNFTNFQIQMDAKNFTDNTYDCVGFTSIPIWSGIFVTFILAMIMIWGISMILDIRTMDRFDDSKGKTITVSAQE